MKIKDLIVKTEKVSWLELKDLQPTNLKTPYHSNITKESLVKNGFAFTFYVWQDKNDIYIIDGHLRKDLLVELKNDGYDIPEQLNCTFLDLPDKKTAIRYLLEVFNTKKNPIDESTMMDWIESEEVEVEDLSVDWLDVQIAPQTKFKDDPNIIEEPFQLFQYNEFAIFPTENKFNIPDLLGNKLYQGDIDDIIWSHNDEEKEPNKTYLAMYGQLAVDDRLKDHIIGFFVDDSRFDVVWNEAVKILYKFDTIKPKALCTPNFSLWSDEPLPFQIMAWYKTMWCGRYWQEAGYEIIPTLNWATKESFDFCFLGLPNYLPTAIIQTRNIKTKQELDNFAKGIFEIKKRFKIGTLFVYGTESPEINDLLSGINTKRIRSWTEKKARQNLKKPLD